MDYRNYIGVYPDFPKKGISFKDISPLVANKEAFASAIKDLAKLGEKYRPDYIIGAESRGFIFGSALALEMGVGFIMGRKAGKLRLPTNSNTGRQPSKSLRMPFPKEAASFLSMI